MSMPRLFLESAGRLLLIAVRALLPVPASAHPPKQSGVWPGLRRRLILLGFIPPFALLQLAHWIGFLLDEILFPGYQRVRIREPLFVLGVPRSGTTLLHRVLAQERTRHHLQPLVSTWVYLFAPSVARVLKIAPYLRLRVDRRAATADFGCVRLCFSSVAR